MRRLLVLLVVAGLVVGAVYAVPYLLDLGTRTQTLDQCRALVQSLAVHLLKEPSLDASDARLSELMRQSGSSDLEGQITRDKTGMPVDAWGHAFGATISYEGGNRYLEVRSAGPDGTFGTDDDCLYRGKLTGGT